MMDKDYLDSEFPEIKFLELVRDQFLTCLNESGIESTEQTCVYGSYFLAMLLRSFATDCCEVKVCGGGLAPGTGLRDPNGVLHSHMWVSTVIRGDLWYVDITEDQFGLPPLIAAKSRDLQMVYIADRQVEIDKMLIEIERDPLLSSMILTN